ncbi:MAG: hypothetical protein QXT28_08975 [Thermofilaceae archaeon]
MSELALIPAASILAIAPLAPFLAARDWRERERESTAVVSTATFAPALATRLALEAGDSYAWLACLAAAALAAFIVLSFLSEKERRRSAALAAALTLPAAAATVASPALGTILAPLLSLALTLTLLATLAAVGP